MADQTALDVSSILPGMTDSHFHSRALAERGVAPGPLISLLREKGFGTIIDVAIRPDDLPAPGFQSSAGEDVYHTCGLHPSHSADPDWRQMLDLMRSLVSSQSPARRDIVAVGETGLDWYREYAPRAQQLEIFQEHLDLASRCCLPVIVHNRQADQDCLQRLSAADLPRGGVMHCFSSSSPWVDRFVDIGMYISFAGNVTFKNATELREAARRVPPERILVETDAPFLAPHPRRGQTNHPGLIGHTYAVIAEARSISVEELVTQVAKNLRALFGISE